jgi:hypothetical protein
MSRMLTASIGIAVALLALGCGSSGDGGDTTEALSKVEFVQQAEGVCEEATRKRKAAAAAWRREHPGDLGEDDLDDAFREVVAPSIAAQAKALQALPAPPQDRVKLRQMVRNLAEGGEEIAKRGTGASQSRRIYDFQREATKLGLKGCVRVY